MEDPEQDPSDYSSEDLSDNENAMNLPLKKKPEKEKARWTDEEVILVWIRSLHESSRSNFLFPIRMLS